MKKGTFFVSFISLNAHPSGTRTRTALTVNRADIITVEAVGLIEEDTEACFVRLRGGRDYLVVGTHTEVWGKLHADQEA